MLLDISVNYAIFPCFSSAPHQTSHSAEAPHTPLKRIEPARQPSSQAPLHDQTQINRMQTGAITIEARTRVERESCAVGVAFSLAPPSAGNASWAQKPGDDGLRVSCRNRLNSATPQRNQISTRSWVWPVIPRTRPTSCENKAIRGEGTCREGLPNTQCRRECR